MPEHTAIKYRIPVVNGHAVYLCIRCGQVVDIAMGDTDQYVYESSDGSCPTCQVVYHQEKPAKK